MISVGFLVKETDWAYAIANTFDVDQETCSGVIVIPKVMVREAHDLGA